MAIQHYIFDIDDTLYLERDYVRSGFDAVGRALSDERFGAYCWDLFCHGVRGNTFELALQKYPHSQSVSTLVDIYRTHRPDISLCDDARAFIESLPAWCGVISDGPIASQRVKFQALGLVPWIDCPIFTAEIAAPKPSPVPYILASWALSAPPQACAYVADNPAKDFAGARACGMATIRIRRPGGLHAEEPSLDDVDREIESLRALMRNA